jgi:membrane dipeptidase
MKFDAHGDILTDIYLETIKGNQDVFRTKHYLNYKKGGITHSIFVNWTDPYNQTKSDFDRIFDVAIDDLKKSSDIVTICHSYQELLQARQEEKFGVLLGIEGIKYLSQPEEIVTLYQKGVRHIGLTWNEENAYATGLDGLENGLKEAGIKLLNLVQKLGMVIDLSHASPKTFNDVFKHTTGPIVVTHGNAKALCNHRRNYTDEQLMQIKERQGVIGVCAVPYFISSDLENQNVQFLAKHIDYIVKKIGIDYVGIGLDVFYYLTPGKTSTNVKGLETLAHVDNLFIELEKMGYSKEDMSKIAYKNFDRVLETVLK